MSLNLLDLKQMEHNLLTHRRELERLVMHIKHTLSKHPDSQTIDLQDNIINGQRQIDGQLKYCLQTIIDLKKKVA